MDGLQCAKDVAWDAAKDTVVGAIMSASHLWTPQKTQAVF